MGNECGDVDRSGVEEGKGRGVGSEGGDEERGGCKGGREKFLLLCTIMAAPCTCCYHLTTLKVLKYDFFHPKNWLMKTVLVINFAVEWYV